MAEATHINDAEQFQDLKRLCLPLKPEETFIANQLLIVQNFIRRTRSNQEFLDWSLNDIIQYVKAGSNNPAGAKS